MPAPPSAPPRPPVEMLAALRAELAAARHTRGPALAFDLAAIDGRLADRGLDVGGLHEFAAASASLNDDAATTLFLAGIAARFANQPTPALPVFGPASPVSCKNALPFAS